MASIRSLPLSPFDAVSPSRGRLTEERDRGAPRIGGSARPVFSTWHSSVAAASLLRFRTQYSKTAGPVEAKLIENETEVRVSGSQTSSRRFKWTKERTSFLTRYMMQHASGVKWKDAVFREDALLNVAEAVSQECQRECSVGDVQRRLRSLREKWRKIERIKGHCSASWDHAPRTIHMREDDYQRYAKVHPMDSVLINRPIEGYDELAFIFGDGKENTLPILRQKRTKTFILSIIRCLKILWSKT